MNRMEQGIASIPRQTMIRDQPHMLAYITPAEAMLLKQNGGSGLPSHGGVPEFGFWSSTFGGGNSFDQSMHFDSLIPIVSEPQAVFISPTDKQFVHLIQHLDDYHLTEPMCNMLSFPFLCI